MKLKLAVALLPLIVLAACDSTTGPQPLQPGKPLAAISAGMEMLQQYEGLSALAVPVLDTEGYQPFFEQYDLTGANVSTPRAADDFVVPSGSTWRVTHVAVIGDLSSTYFDNNLHFYDDAPGSPGVLFATRGVTILDQQQVQPGFSWFYMMQLDEPLVLGAGTYWMAADLMQVIPPSTHLFHSWWSLAVMDDSNPMMSRNPDTHQWAVPFWGNRNLAFGLYSQAITLEDVLTAFDGWVDAGTLAGAGPGRSADGRIGALRNMLVEAGNLLEAGDLAGACSQLWDAYLRTDGDPQPPDFVSGSSASLLADIILQLRNELGCL
jgi:hypothetical protein